MVIKLATFSVLCIDGEITRVCSVVEVIESVMSEDKENEWYKCCNRRHLYRQFFWTDLTCKYVLDM